MAQRLKTDWTLFGTVLVMVLFGGVMIYSASSMMAASRNNSAFYFALHQAIWIALAVPTMVWLKHLPYRKLQNTAVSFIPAGIVVVLLIAVYFLDAKQHRWLRFPGGGLQPSEFAKPALALFLAYFMSIRGRAINSLYTLLPASLVVGLVTFAVVMADLGTAIVLVVMAGVVYFVAGLGWKQFVALTGVVFLGICVSVVVRPYRLCRVVVKFDPEFKLIDKVDKWGWVRGQMAKSITTRDPSYQPLQARIALGSGGPAGLGLMQGRQKLMYLPEAHTDEIYAVVGEELGLFGTVGLLVGFLVIGWRGIRATMRAQDEFGKYLALSLTTLLVVQAFFNMTVVLDMIPTKGIPLPMISYGGSSLLATLISLGILMNVSEHAS